MKPGPAGDQPLPALRDDLQLLEGPSELDGSPTWTTFDPVRNSYFRIGWIAFELLSRWNAGDAETLLERIRKETTCQVTRQDLTDLLKFLYANSLTRESVNNTSGDYYRQYLASRPNRLLWLLKNYLFLRIPLVHPDRFLRLLLPGVEPLYTVTARNFMVMLGFVGLYLAIHQWDSFASTFLYFFSWQGAVFYALALIVVKILHELGHALTAMRYGCRIPTMGIAFLVLIPVLYTDTTDAWRLTSRGQRLKIGAAGMIAELYIALVCTFLWSFLPDGILRSTAFVFATISWLLTLAINLNPFMRFDGYYILSDWLGVQNLQARAFAFGRWKLRQLLFAAEEGPPEKLPENIETKLVVYAWLTWAYRFVIFAAIAVLIYYFFFKLLGIILFIAEIYWFIIHPVARELNVWWKMRNRIARTGRFAVTFLVCLLLASLFFIPWSSRISLPAILEIADKATVYAPVVGRIREVNIREGDTVDKGDVLLVLESPWLDQEILRTRKRIEALALRSDRRASNIRDLSDLHVILQQLREQTSTLAGLHGLKDRLVIRAPLRGKVAEMAESLHPGRWINEKLALAFITATGDLTITGTVYENDLSRVAVSQPATFIPDDPGRERVKAVITELEQANIARLDIPYLASPYGGEIAVRPGEDGRLVPETSIYRVKFRISDQVVEAPDQVLRGVVHVRGEPRSFAGRLFESVAAVLVRESGF